MPLRPTSHSDDKIVVVACVTSHYAAMVAKHAVEHWTKAFLT
ncbi:hypothetical protein [Nocardioides dilutus]